MKKKFIVLMTSVSIITFSQTGNVGINTTLPTNTLTVNGNSSVGSGYATIAAPVNGMLIEGNVGIGTVAPTAKLDINGKIKITDGTQETVKYLPQMPMELPAGSLRHILTPSLETII